MAYLLLYPGSNYMRGRKGEAGTYCWRICQDFLEIVFSLYISIVDDIARN